MKYSILITIVILVGGILYYWLEFVKPKPITDLNLISFCIEKGSLILVTREGMKYIEYVDMKENGDTLQIKVYSTTIFNIFSKKLQKQEIDLRKKDYRFIEFGSGVIPIQEIGQCSQ